MYLILCISGDTLVASSDTLQIETIFSGIFLNGPFILCRNCVALPQCNVLHRNCDVTALWCHMKVKLILIWNDVMLQWLAAESNQYTSTTTQWNVRMNRPLGTLTIKRNSCSSSLGLCRAPHVPCTQWSNYTAKLLFQSPIYAALWLHGDWTMTV